MTSEPPDILSELLNLLKKARQSNEQVPTGKPLESTERLENSVKVKRPYRRKDPEQFTKDRAANKLSLAISRTEKSVARVEKGLSLLPDFAQQLNLFPHLKPKLDPRISKLQEKRKRWETEESKEDSDERRAPMEVAKDDPTSTASSVVVQVDSAAPSASMDTEEDRPEASSILRVAELTHPAGESAATAQVRAPKTQDVKNIFSSLNFKF